MVASEKKFSYAYHQSHTATQRYNQCVHTYVRIVVYVIIEASAEARVHRMTSYKHTNVLEATGSLNALL